MRVSQQHPQIAMPAYERDLGNAQALLEQAAYGFMPQIVKPQVLNSGSSLHALPSQANRVCGCWEKPSSFTACALSNSMAVMLNGIVRERPFFTLGYQQDALGRIKVCLLDCENFPAPHRRLKPERHDWRNEPVAAPRSGQDELVLFIRP
jgi:hypothetical protein